MPICNTCALEKPFSSFTPNRWTKSGHTNKCKACCAAYSREHRRKNPEIYKAQGKRKYAKFRAIRPSAERIERVTAEGRWCTRCEKRHSADNFGRQVFSKDGISNVCKECLRHAARERRYGNLELSRAKERAKAKKGYERNKAAILVRREDERLKYRYGLTKDTLADLLAAQDGKCAICSAALALEKGAESMVRANVDHCHTTKIVRGLLCSTCNTGLGAFKDDPLLLKSAIEYLAQF